MKVSRQLGVHWKLLPVGRAINVAKRSFKKSLRGNFLLLCRGSSDLLTEGT